MDVWDTKEKHEDGDRVIYFVIAKPFDLRFAWAESLFVSQPTHLAGIRAKESTKAHKKGWERKCCPRNTFDS